MNESLVLGIDTSAYTTSVAVLTASGRLLADQRVVLSVPEGSRGLRQSEAVYQHVRNLPDVCEKAFGLLPSHAFTAVCVSTVPRPVEGSYMPVFQVGSGLGRSIAAVTQAPLMNASHQEGHLWAALWSLEAEAAHELQAVSSILAVHLSGGTTEALHVSGVGNEYLERPHMQLVGNTHDISAGQFIDRVGTALGLPFPAGAHLERLAEQGSEGQVKLPIAINGNALSFSGPESAAQRAIQSGALPADIARATFDCVATTLEKWLAYLSRTTNVSHIVVAGGVASSLYIRRKLATSNRLQTRLAFAAKPYASDNAVGLAAWACACEVNLPILSLPDRALCR